MTDSKTIERTNGNRHAVYERKTSETDIRVEVDLDAREGSLVNTPLPFLSHMVEQIARHGRLKLSVHAEGDTHIDGHHTTEDLGFSLGRAFADALGEKRGIERYGYATLPMDEALATCALDLSGRPFFVWNVPVPKVKLGTFDAELAEVFFEAFARGSQCNLHFVLHAGQNVHHIIEICFKAFARALRMAISVVDDSLPSTKGSLVDR